MSRLDGCHNIAGLREAARRRVPRLVFDYIDGGVDDETCLRRNRDAFDRVTLLPDYLVDVSQLRLHRTLFGRQYNMPLGIAPTGLASFARHGADLMLARCKPCWHPVCVVGRRHRLDRSRSPSCA